MRCIAQSQRFRVQVILSGVPRGAKAGRNAVEGPRGNTSEMVSAPIHSPVSTSDQK